ncbi:hypothetical protein [Streptomyces sp. GQFP]|uniref:hypothetical protein n=1 Tax=Streptomyces sp. GQFP TaxID=2907545 RepID=UPI001F3E85C2|nr:hypothetical protein [Streptomyces sp. GQFP]UIX29557.1 hypothetical protein LUX31_05630 [Streptomyces sp. GQFP]
MTAHQDALAKATTAYISADEALSAAITSAVRVSEIKAVWDTARATRLAYAKALEDAGHSVSAGLDYDKDAE